MAEKFPAPVYADTVLGPNFEHAKQHFLDALIQIHYAHTIMLAKQEIVTPRETRALLEALGGLHPKRIQAARYDGSREDLFFFVEAMLEEACGREIAGKMHTARSRNDIAITLYRMKARRALLATAGEVLALRAALLHLAEQHLETVMPAHTHTQPAQPTTLGHYLLAACEFLGRDAERMRNAFARVNLCPMGAAALTTTGFPIDRDYTARLLGFEGIAENSYGAIAGIDYITEAAAVVAVAMVNAGKLIQDLLLWSTREFGFLRMSDGFVQSSSIMPQKRNPVALEHTRILASRALGEAQAVLTCAHNTPFGDINDSEDDLQPLVTAMFESAGRALRLLAGAMKTAEVDRKRMALQAAKDFLTVTELADTLVRREGMSFREAHALVAEAVRTCQDDSAEAIAKTLAKLRPGLKMKRAEILKALDAENFVRVRKVTGGPAPERTREALERARGSQRELEAWVAQKSAMIEEARKGLRR
jgi:argininosuccinate lyase